MVGNASTCLHNKYVVGVCKNIISVKLKRLRLRQASYATTDSLLWIDSYGVTVKTSPQPTPFCFSKENRFEQEEMYL